MSASIIKNIDVLIAAVKAEPSKKFDLSTYVQEKPSCGTLHCTAGLAATLPYFKRRGWKLYINGDGGFGVLVKGVYVSSSSVVNSQFGDDAWDRLFDVRWSGEFDRFHPKYLDSSVTDKELALWRLRMQRAAYAK